MPRKHKIAIIVGHTRRSPGVFAAAPLSVSEFDYNSVMAELVFAHVMSAGHEGYVIIRDEHTDRQGADALVNVWKADASVELHFNAFDKKARGTRTLYVDNQHSSKDLARFVQNAMVTALERQEKQNRGASPILPGDRGHLNLSLLKCPAVLVEPFFGDQVDDAKLGLERRPALSETIAAALVAFCNQEYGE